MSASRIRPSIPQDERVFISQAKKSWNQWSRPARARRKVLPVHDERRFAVVSALAEVHHRPTAGRLLGIGQPS
jgi:hypothetical protein